MTLIDKLELFFKGKPIHIIMALVTITGVIVGVSFAISAIIKNLNKNKPCTNDKFIKYKDYDNLCGPNCTAINKNVCPELDNKNKIINITCVDSCPEDHTYDKLTCKCVPDCSNGMYGDGYHNTPEYRLDNNGEFKWECVQKCSDTVSCPMNTWCDGTNTCVSLNKIPPDYCPPDSLNLCKDGKICNNGKCEYPECGKDEVVWIGQQSKIKCEDLDPSYTKEIFQDLKSKNNIVANICVQNTTDKNGNNTKNTFKLKGGALCVKKDKFYKHSDTQNTSTNTENMLDTEMGVGYCVNKDDNIIGINNNIQCENVKDQHKYCRNRNEMCSNGWQVSKSLNGKSTCIKDDFFKKISKSTGNGKYTSSRNYFGDDTITDEMFMTKLNDTGICCPGAKKMKNGNCCFGLIDDNDNKNPVCLRGPMKHNEYTLDYSQYSALFEKAGVSTNPTRGYTRTDVKKLNNALSSDLSSISGVQYDDLKSVSNVKFVLSSGKLFLGCGNYDNDKLEMITKIDPKDRNKKIYMCGKKTTPIFNIKQFDWTPSLEKYNSDENGLALTCYNEADSADGDISGAETYWYNHSIHDQYYAYSNQIFTYDKATVPYSDNSYICDKIFNSHNNSISTSKNSIDNTNNSLSQVPGIETAREITTLSNGPYNDSSTINEVNCKNKFDCNKQMPK